MSLFNQNNNAKINQLSEQLADMAYNVKNYGAIGDGLSHKIRDVFPSVTLAQVQALNASATLDDEADWYAIQTCFNASKSKAYIPDGTYMISKPIVVPTYLSIDLLPYKTKLKATSAITVMIVDDIGGGAYGNRYGYLKNLTIDGNNIATTGLYVGIINCKLFENIYVSDCVGTGMICDTSQNSVFNNVTLEKNGVNLKMLNGVGNNVFNGLFVGLSTNEGVIFAEDSTVRGYSYAIFQNNPTNNYFNKFLIEEVATFAVKINKGNQNTFMGFDNAKGQVYIESGANNNRFVNVGFSYNGNPDPAIINNGYQTVFENVTFTSYPSGFEVGHIYNQIIISNILFGNNTVFVNKSGQIATNIINKDIFTFSDTTNDVYSPYPNGFGYNANNFLFFKGKNNTTTQLLTGKQLIQTQVFTGATALSVPFTLTEGMWLVSVDYYTNDKNHMRSNSFLCWYVPNKVGTSSKLSANDFNVGASFSASTLAVNITAATGASTATVTADSSSNTYNGVVTAIKLL